MAKDIFHSAVREGLEKEGWLITDDPLRITADCNLVSYDFDLQVSLCSSVAAR